MARAPLTRHGGAVALACAVIALGMLGGCRDGDDVPDSAPTEIAVVPVTPGTSDTPVRDGVGTGPGAQATWTLPPGVRPPPELPGELPGEVPEVTDAPPAPVPETGPPLVDPEIAVLLEQVDPSRLAADVRKLEGFGTRHALSVDDDPDRGVGAARDWIHASFEAANLLGEAQVQVVFEDFELDFAGQRTTQRNVIATLPGLEPPKRFVYVTAHYDSRVEDVTDGGSAAPGADDNASGTALLLELARVLSARQWEAGIRLVAFAAEEPGLKGSRHHAEGAEEFGLPILAVLNNDIVGGGPNDAGVADAGSFFLYSAPPDDSPSRRLARYVAAVAERYVPLEAVVQPDVDRPDRGGDHQPFSDAGYPAVRIMEASEDLTRQHTARDTAERLDPEYHALVARINIAAAANLALAPQGVETPPRVAPSPEGWAVSWEPSPDPETAGYWVAWRGPDDARYQGLAWSPEPRAILQAPGPVRVAVAAADPQGHMSLFSPESETVSEGSDN